MRSTPINFFFILILLTAVSCSKFRKIEKNPDWRVKYEAAMNYYNDENYYKASLLFEQILPVVRGLPEGEKVQFYLAYCQYYDKLYLLASEHFQTFYETYGRSSFVEEARFMHAYSLFEVSPKYNLDQTNSIQAMAAMQSFLNRYPNSKFRERATNVIDEIQVKLEKKGFENARQYFKLRYYQAAIVALTNFTLNFPDSKYREEAEFLILTAQYRWAEQSIQSRQPERYRAALEYYKEFIDTYPQSRYRQDAERVYTGSIERINETNNKNL